MTNYYGKIVISGKICVVSGLHIGGSSAFAAIGATDSPVIRDVVSGLLLIPGSSLKGKLRTLLAKVYNQEIAQNPNQDDLCIRKLFGDSNEIKSGRLIFRDCLLSNYDELMAKGADSVTEVKFENTIDRKTSEAMPRQIERVIPQARFGLEIVYDYQSSEEVDHKKEILTDLSLLKQGMDLLEFDYLGGHGSRGYGKIAFENLKAEAVLGNLEASIYEAVNEFFQSR